MEIEAIKPSVKRRKYELVKHEAFNNSL